MLDAIVTNHNLYLAMVAGQGRWDRNRYLRLEWDPEFDARCNTKTIKAAWYDQWFTKFYKQTQLSQHVFCSTKVPLFTFWFGFWFFCQKLIMVNHMTMDDWRGCHSPHSLACPGMRWVGRGHNWFSVPPAEKRFLCYSLENHFQVNMDRCRHYDNKIGCLTWSTFSRIYANSITTTCFFARLMYRFWHFIVFSQLGH